MTSFIRVGALLVAVLAAGYGGLALSLADDRGNPGVAGRPVLTDRLTGYYALRARAASRARVIFLGTVRNALTAYGLVEITGAGTELRWRERICRNDMESNKIKVTVDDRVVQSIPASVGTLSVRQKGDAVRWVRSEQRIAIGFRDDGSNRPLPTQLGDPRVYDQDGDGHPGVTLHLETPFGNGDTYGVQRVLTSIRGRVEGKRLVGEQVARTEQSILDATLRRLKMAVPLKHDASGDNSVVLVPVQASWDCAALLRNDRHLTLFGA